MFIKLLNNPAFFYVSKVTLVLALAIAVYYAIPNFDHLLVKGSSTGMHIKFVIVFSAIALICMMAFIVTRPRSGT